MDHRAALATAVALFASAACNSPRSLAPSAPLEGTPLAVGLRTHATRVEVLAAGEPFATVQLADEAGPYIDPLLARGGAAVTRAVPLDTSAHDSADNTLDHPHHRSFWFAHGDVDGHDFWHGPAHIDVVGHTVGVQSLSVATVELDLVWRTAQQKEIVHERRRLTFHAEEGLRWIDCVHVLEAADNAVVFRDSKEGTFALRLAPTLASEGPGATGRLFDAEGREGGDVWGQRATWCAATGQVAAPSGEPRAVTVAVLEHPANPGAPTRWHARPYGLLAANPFGKAAFGQRSLEADGSFGLSRGERLVLRYRVLIGDGPLDEARIEREVERYASDLEAGSLVRLDRNGQRSGAAREPALDCAPQRA